jgi:hypothetical protein
MQQGSIPSAEGYRTDGMRFECMGGTAFEVVMGGHH